MFRKSIFKAFLAICITATLWVALCGCDDLGVYEDTEEYWNSFGEVSLVSGTSKKIDGYSVEEYFYNESSREDFLVGEDGKYKGADHSDYSYMVVPFESSINMDSFALYLQSQTDVTLYVDLYVVSYADWEVAMDILEAQGKSDGSSDTGADGGVEGDNPISITKIGAVSLVMKKDKWSSFVLDFFDVNKTSQKSIQINDGQCILLQFKNNSDVRVFDEEKQIYLDPQTGYELKSANITMTNLLIRALTLDNSNKAQGGE